MATHHSARFWPRSGRTRHEDIGLEYAATEDLMHVADRLPRFGVVTVLVGLFAIPLTGRQQPPTTTRSQTQVVLLGTGDPAADPDQSGPATAVVVNDTPYLVDFG